MPVKGFLLPNPSPPEGWPGQLTIAQPAWVRDSGRATLPQATRTSYGVVTRRRGGVSLTAAVRRAALRVARLPLLTALTRHTDAPLWRAAADQGARSYATLAARTRWAHGIPPLSEDESALLPLGRCAHCDRPWQFDQDGACPRCPAALQGTTSQDSEEATRFPGHPVDASQLAMPVLQAQENRRRTSASRRRRSRRGGLRLA
ncbi:hypothetical protein GCM10010428_44250 [Actinosynnema pretiosum subsp. pretiosum]